MTAEYELITTNIIKCVDAYHTCTQDALMDYLEGSTVVVVMGGHGVRRASDEYRQVSL
jgi:hypothetical protein